MTTSTANDQSHPCQPNEGLTNLKSTDKTQEPSELEMLFKVLSNPSVTPARLGKKFGLPTDAVHVSEGIKNSPY